MRDNDNNNLNVQKPPRRSVKTVGRKNPKACAKTLRVQRAMDQHGVGVKTANSWKKRTPLVYNINKQVEKASNDNGTNPLEEYRFRAGKSYRLPPSWRNLLDKEKSYWLYKSISHERLATFTLNLSEKVLKQVNNNHSCAPYILKRIQRSLNNHFPDMRFNIYVAAECFSKSGARTKLHVHGVISLLNIEDVRALRKALKDAGGKDYNNGSTHEGNQLNLDTAPFDAANWVAYYCTKALHNTVKEVSGKVIACTKRMKTIGREIYERDRGEMINACKK